MSGATAPMEVYDPHSRGGRGNGGHGSVPRSRLNQKSSHKSQTYTSHSRRGRCVCVCVRERERERERDLLIFTFLDNHHGLVTE